MPPDRSSVSSLGSSGKDNPSQPTKRPYAKANRSLKACDTCHARKTRCSGDQPCKFCVSRGLKCVMSDDMPRAGATRKNRGSSHSQQNSDLPESLEEREPRHSASPPVLAMPPIPSLHTAPLTHYPATAPLPLPMPFPSHPPPSFLPLPRGRSSPNTAAYYSDPALPMKPDSPFRPPSSGPVATQPFSRPHESPSASMQGFHSPMERLPLDGTIFNRFQRTARYTQEADITTLITKEKSNRYLDLYFSEAECIYQLWPVPSIIQHCHDFIWDEIPKTEMYPDTVPRPGLRSTLTALLAFGALLDRDTRESEMLYHAARSCYLSVMDGSTLESVHLALQLAVYEMNSRRANSAIHTVAVAIRTAQHLHLHRKTRLLELSSEETLRCTLLWFSCVIQDCWISMASGNPPMINGNDCDLDTSILDSELHTASNFISPFLELLIRLSGIWSDAHAKLFGATRSAGIEMQWTEALSAVDTDLRLWQRDIHQLYARLSVSLKRSERLHCQAVLLTFSSMRLTVHRALLLKTTSSESPKQTDTLQLILSQNAILDSAMDIAAYAKASLQLGMKPCFAFLATSLYIGYLALWEHLQIKQSPGRIDDTSKIEQGMNNIIWAVDYIHKTGDNSAMAEIVAAIRAMGRSPARNRLTSVEPPLHTPTVASDGNYAGNYTSTSYDLARVRHITPQYGSSGRESPESRRPSTSNAAYIPRPAEIRLFERSSWPGDLPSGNFRQEAPNLPSQQNREYTDVWQH